MLRKTEQASPPLIPPSVPFLSSSHSRCGPWAVPQPRAVDLTSLISWKVLGKDIHYLKVLQRVSMVSSNLVPFLLGYGSRDRKNIHFSGVLVV